MTPQRDLKRFESGPLLAWPMREYVTEEGCRVVSHAQYNRYGELVERVTLSTAKVGERHE